ncbi:MAG: SH3 domain-containing protein [Acidobacteria bacterium]|nr:SH3 domain-containing protein [Acidobacteriota bacterium]
MLKTINNADKLRQANPEDLIIISVSSHGFADKNGVFYLLASDANTISSDELSMWLRDVDGGEISLIIDACRSASAVETADFKPAPMNSRGLGQLSYDKGMRILTATQADNVALETNQTRQGLLSYALLQNGLNDFQADFKPQDRTIVMSEWLNFGVERVPRLYEEASSRQAKLVRETNDTAETETQQRQEKTQRPSLFDFSRKNRDATIEKRAGSVQSKVVETPQTVTPTPTPVSTPKPIPEGFNGRVIKYDTVIVRAADSTGSAEVGKVYRNDSIKIGAQKGEWFQVTTISGVQGWMHGNSLEFVRR